MRAAGTPASPPTCSNRGARPAPTRVVEVCHRWLPVRRLMRQIPGRVMLACVALLAADATAGDRQLVPFEIVGMKIPEPLTDIPGNPEIGKRIVTDASNATCLICHPMPIPEQPDNGNMAPDLAGVGSRYSAGELRLRIVDPKVINPETIMPAYYRLSGFTRVQPKYAGQTVYSAQDVEDAIAYLLTLTDG